MKSVEQFLVTLEGWPWSAVWRVLLGFAIPPVFSAISGGNDAVWIHIALFIGLLAALRIVPALLRFTLPFSPDTKEIWRRRRFIAKEYDSHQWQKLFWIGLGMLPHCFADGGLGLGELAIVAICLVGGGAGLWAWLKVGEGRLG